MKEIIRYYVATIASRFFTLEMISFRLLTLYERNMISVDEYITLVKFMKTSYGC